MVQFNQFYVCLTIGPKATWIVWYLGTLFSRCILPIIQSMSVAMYQHMKYAPLDKMYE
jgi:hypothetical protein